MRGDDRDRRRDLAHPGDRGPDLLEVGHRLDPDEIDATRDERCCLLGEDIDGLIEIECADGHHDRAGWPDIAGNERIGSARFDLRPEQQRGHLVELGHPVLVPIEADPESLPPNVLVNTIREPASR